MTAPPSLGLGKSVDDLVATALGKVHRGDPVTRRSGGPAGNARLTAWLGLALLLLFLVESATLISLHPLIDVHIFVGAVLVPVVLAKTATTGWRMVRYYLGDRKYVVAGPPPLLLRLMGPLVVLSGLAVLGTGLSLIALGQAGTVTPLVSVAGFQVSPLTLHQAAFIVWLVVTAIHVLARGVPAAQLAVGAKPGRNSPVPGAMIRAGVLIGIVLPVSIVVGAVVLHLSSDWTGSGGFHGGGPKAGNGARPGSKPTGSAGTPARLVARVAGWKLPAPLSRASAATEGSQVVLAGGLLSDGRSTAAVTTIDPLTGASQPMPALPAGVHDATADWLGARDLVLGGGSAASIATVQQSSPGGAGVVGHLPGVRSDLSSAVVGGTLYVFGGYDGATLPSVVLSTSDGRHFAVAGHLAVPVRYAAVATVNSSIYVFGGEDSQGSAVSVVQRFDPATGKTALVGHLPDPVSAAAAGVVDDQVVIAGGRLADGSIDGAVRRWIPARHTSVPVAHLPRPVANAAVAAADGQLWLFGGETAAGPVATVQVVKPASR